MINYIGMIQAVFIYVIVSDNVVSDNLVSLVLSFFICVQLLVEIVVLYSNLIKLHNLSIDLL